jgi:hypothetical protein
VLAQSVSHKKALAPKRPRKNFVGGSSSADLLKLLLEAEDRAHDLLQVQQTFSAFGKLVCASFENPRAQLDADRGELSALLGVMNQDAACRIAKAIAAVEIAREAVRNREYVAQGA